MTEKWSHMAKQCLKNWRDRRIQRIYWSKNPPAGTSAGTSAGIGKPVTDKGLEAPCELNSTGLVMRVGGRLLWVLPPWAFTDYQRKIPCASSRGRGKGGGKLLLWNKQEHSVLNEACPQGKPVIQSLSDWPRGREIPRSSHSSHPVHLKGGVGRKLRSTREVHSPGAWAP